jgi:uncharacterized protein (TIGR02444 family)
MSPPPQVKAFWDWSLDVYQRRAVADACIKLQDGFGLDVNMLLFCCWAARAGFPPLRPELVSHAAGLSAQWSEAVTRRLRAARRALKEPPLHVPAGDAESLRANILEAELDAERIQQNFLEDLLAASSEGDAPIHDSVRLRARAQENLAVYLAHAGVAVAGRASRQPLDTLIAATLDR